MLAAVAQVLPPPTKKGAGKNNKLNFPWLKMAHLGPPFYPKIPPQIVYVGSFSAESRFFPGNEAHHFIWGPKVVLRGDEKVYVEILSSCSTISRYAKNVSRIQFGDSLLVPF